MADQLELLSTQLTAISGRLRSGSGVETERAEILKATGGISAALKRPVDDLMGAMIEVTKATSIRLLIKWGVFAAIPPAGGVSVEELAAKAQVDAGLLSMSAPPSPQLSEPFSNVKSR